MEKELRAVIKDLKKPEEEELVAASELLQSSGNKGIWILAPEKLAIDKDSGVRIFGFDYYDTKPRGFRFVESSGVAVATRIESRETSAALVRLPKERDRSHAERDTPTIEDDENEDDENLLGFSFSLRERLPDLPWRSGTYVVDVLLDGQESNRLRFQLTPGVSAERDPAIAEYIETHRGTITTPTNLAPAPVEGAKEPSYKQSPASPALPKIEGINLSVERVNVYRPSAQLILHGSFRLPVPAAFYQGGTPGTPTATVPITLVITGNDLIGPFVAPLRTATYDPVNPNALETSVTGYFAIDLFALRETSKVVQTYTIWAYSGAVRSEKVRSAVITPNMLR